MSEYDVTILLKSAETYYEFCGHKFCVGLLGMNCMFTIAQLQQE